LTVLNLYAYWLKDSVKYRETGTLPLRERVRVRVRVRVRGISHNSSSSGVPILPSTADAAATAGLERYTSLSG